MPASAKYPGSVTGEQMLLLWENSCQQYIERLHFTAVIWKKAVTPNFDFLRYLYGQT